MSNQGLRANGFDIEKVEIGNGTGPDDCLTWDAASVNPGLAFALARIDENTMPTPIGVFRKVEMPTFEAGVHQQLAANREKVGPGDLEKILFSGDTWEVK